LGSGSLKDSPGDPDRDPKIRVANPHNCNKRYMIFLLHAKSVVAPEPLGPVIVIFKDPYPCPTPKLLNIDVRSGCIFHLNLHAHINRILRYY